VLTICDSRGRLPWQDSGDPPGGSARDFEMLALFFAEHYQLAQVQLMSGDKAAKVLCAAIGAGHTCNELVTSLLSQLAHWLPPDLIGAATKWLRSTTGDFTYERTVEKSLKWGVRDREIRARLRGEFSHMMTVNENST
jgi:hypothetical protein